MHNYTKILISVVFGMLLLGLVMILSASSTYSALKFNAFYSLFSQQIIKVIVAIALMLGAAVIPYSFYKKHAKNLMLFIIILLVITFIIAAKVKGAGRWISFFAFSFQPSELSKIVLIVYLSALLEKKKHVLQSFRNGLSYPLGATMLVVGLVLIQPNVSTAMIIMSTGLALIFVAGANLKHMFSIAATGLSLGGIAMMIMPHSRVRVMTYVNSLMNGGDINTQVRQAKIALGSGGVTGLGIGHSRQSDLFLPESYGDFIFSVLGEELGFIGAIAVMVAYLSIIVIGILIAKRTKDDFGQLLAFGLSFIIAVSGFINASVVIGLLPTTGITLPFISYGGSSVVIMCIAVGILINISTKINKETKTLSPEINRIEEIRI